MHTPSQCDSEKKNSNATNKASPLFAFSFVRSLEVFMDEENSETFVCRARMPAEHGLLDATTDVATCAQDPPKGQASTSSHCPRMKKTLRHLVLKQGRHSNTVSFAQLPLCKVRTRSQWIIDFSSLITDEEDTETFMYLTKEAHTAQFHAAQ